MRYWPVSSVTTERTFSISAGLAASTVTPGKHAARRVLDDAGDGGLRIGRRRQEHRTNRTPEDRLNRLNITSPPERCVESTPPTYVENVRLGIPEGRLGPATGHVKA